MYRYMVRLDRARRHANRKAVIAKENSEYMMNPEFKEAEHQLEEEFIKDKLQEQLDQGNTGIIDELRYDDVMA